MMVCDSIEPCVFAEVYQHTAVTFALGLVDPTIDLTLRFAYTSQCTGVTYISLTVVGK